MSKQWRIFVIEDDESLNRQIVNALHKDGYSVHGAANKREAVRVLWAEEHDAVICDLKTLNADDIDLLQWLRAYRPGVRVIFVGPPDNAARVFALESGAASYVDRPLDLSKVRDELHRLLSQTGFSANLDSFDLLDVIQIVSASRKNIALLVNTGLEERGMLCFQEGNMIWAEYGMLRGEEAFFALAAHKNGTVIHQPWNQYITPNVTQPLSRLILQALQYRAKYEQRQNSGEQAVLHPMQEQVEVLGQGAPAPLYDVDDTPFLVALEETSPSTGGSDIFAQGQQPAWEEQKHTTAPQQGYEALLQESLPAVRDEFSKEWWQQTGKMTTLPGISSAGPALPTSPEQQGAASEVESATQLPVSRVSRTTNPFMHHAETPWKDGSGPRRVPPGMRKTHMRGDSVGRDDTNARNEQARHEDSNAQAVSQHPLPSWLTDMPTETNLPALPPYGANTSPSSQSTKLPVVPPTPNLQSAEWQPVVERDASAPLDNVAHGPMDSLTGTYPRVRAAHDSPSAEWRGATGPSYSGQFPSITASRLANSTAAPSEQRDKAYLSTSGATSGSREQGANNGVGGVSDASGKQQTEKQRYNATALIPALETLGYSVAGFVATAVVTLNGQLLAQVAADELDRAGLCQGLSQVVRGMLATLWRGNLGKYCETLITSDDNYVFLRLIRTNERGHHVPVQEFDEEVFQVLITTRNAGTTECREMMENVEEAIVAALHA